MTKAKVLEGGSFLSPFFSFKMESLMYDILLDIAQIISAHRFMQMLIIVNVTVCVFYCYYEITYVRRKEREYREEMDWLVKLHQWKADNARDSVQH